MHRRSEKEEEKDDQRYIPEVILWGTRVHIRGYILEGVYIRYISAMAQAGGSPAGASLICPSPCSLGAPRSPTYSTQAATTTTTTDNGGKAH